ncbi:MAG: precorrin-2 C(20)-methyltransferase [Bacillota bacterium]
MKGKFYGIGIGPGDPGLVTVKAVEILNKVDIVIAPETKHGKGSTAFQIVQGHIQDHSKVRLQIFPMTYDRDALEKSWIQNRMEIVDFLHSGKSVGFITLGDPMIYSTYIYLLRDIQNQGFETETIPGIPSFCAAASKLGIPLTEGDENLCIIPAAYDSDNIDQLLASGDNFVLMKPSKDFPHVVDTLERHDLAENAVLISKCGHEDEKIEYDVKKQRDEKIDYLSMLIVKRGRTNQ